MMTTRQNHPDRNRKLIYQFDPSWLFSSENPERTAFGGYGLKEFQEYGFEAYDTPGSQVGAIWWDCAFGDPAIYPSSVLPPNPHLPFKKWLADGFDIVKYFVENTRKRGLEVFWNFRVSGLDGFGSAASIPLDKVELVKAAHPGWLLKTWWPFGIWNYAMPEVRQFQADIIFELAENYDWDGFQIDFARHLPILPVGKQWELRGHVTDFMRKVRTGLNTIGRRKGKTIQVCARINRAPAGARIDGLDIKAWVDEGLVDMLTIGSRSFEVDLQGWRDFLKSDIKLFPCIDACHYTDGYREAPLEILRGVADRFWHEGADRLVLFNWLEISPESIKKLNITYNGKAVPNSSCNFTAITEIGDRSTLKGKDKTFPVERRGNYMMGGYRYSEGSLNDNAHAQLPLILRWDGTPAIVKVKTSDDFERLNKISLDVILSNTFEGDTFSIKLNQQELKHLEYDFRWEDPHMVAPSPELGRAQKDGKLLKVRCCDIPVETVKSDLNVVAVGISNLVITERRSACRQVFLEKVELGFCY